MSPALAGPKQGRVRWRQKRGCLVARSGAYKVRVEAELSEVLKPPDSVPRTPQPRTPGPSRSSQLLPRPRRRPSSLIARRPTCGPEAGNCRPSALCPDGTVTAEPTSPTRNLLLGSNTRASEVPL
ncbi:protein capicua homolog [Zalophus californianus]|uniref:Protein capicua homolog n=1 Tax=Zalophus californianus TaxID=9704 RepID=A0A6J2BY85_ZALCA|nr:protein capicua homolog [Zalophus californianus]